VSKQLGKCLATGAVPKLLLHRKTLLVTKESTPLHVQPLKLLVHHMLHSYYAEFQNGRWMM
jgi:hypothetical protein